MKIKHALIGLLLMVLNQINYGQQRTIEPKEICVNNQYNSIQAVTEFKDSLNVTINITSLTVGVNSKEIHTDIKVKIKDETLIYKLSKDAAISLSVVRAVENGEKYYYYKINLYRRVNKCWENVYTNAAWARFNLGGIASGYGIGVEGTSSFIGFRGSLNIE